MPTELELIALRTEFELYLTFTKRLVLNLPDSNDRVRAAMWLQKLRSIEDDNFKKLRNEHLKLLLFALHRRSMVGIFENKPPDELESFHDGLTLMEMTRELIEMTEKKKSKDLAPNECPLPAVRTSISADLKEYTSAQMIPKFGAHVYYAVSCEPIQFWKKSANTKYPGSGDIPNPQQWENVFAKLSDHVLEQQAAVDAAIELAKAIEKGEASEDDLNPDLDFSKKIDVKGCDPVVFKWKKDSNLNLHQTYEIYADGDIDNIEKQGRHQLELDEEAFSILDTSLPGRQRVVIRDPYYRDVPHDLADRRMHGVVEEVPEPIEEEDEDEDEEEPCPCCPSPCPASSTTSPPPPPPPPPPAQTLCQSSFASSNIQSGCTNSIETTLSSPCGNSNSINPCNSRIPSRQPSFPRTSPMRNERTPEHLTPRQGRTPETGTPRKGHLSEPGTPRMGTPRNVATPETFTPHNSRTPTVSSRNCCAPPEPTYMPQNNYSGADYPPADYSQPEYVQSSSCPSSQANCCPPMYQTQQGGQNWTGGHNDALYRQDSSRLKYEQSPPEQYDTSYQTYDTNSCNFGSVASSTPSNNQCGYGPCSVATSTPSGQDYNAQPKYNELYPQYGQEIVYLNNNKANNCNYEQGYGQAAEWQQMNFELENNDEYCPCDDADNASCGYETPTNYNEAASMDCCPYE